MSALKLGTRRSLLAQAQSGWVAREIERLNPGTRVELVGIETRGDQTPDIPLRMIEGKEFFVAELDEALRSKKVDFTVHSLKDLSLERPPEFTLAAIPRREDPRDALIVGPKFWDRLAQGQTIRIGSSSPRRQENLVPCLKAQWDELTKFEIVDLRGNVNTRLGRVHLEPANDKYLDGVVLALAGLNRLARDEAAGPELKRLLQNTRVRALGVTESPPAPGQGALAVECRADDFATQERLRKLHDPESADRIARERALLEELGGGCHQRFGACALKHPELDELFYVKGLAPTGERLDRREWKTPTVKTNRPVVSWDSSQARGSLFIEERLDAQALQSTLEHRIADVRARGAKLALFVAHSRALPTSWAPWLSPLTWGGDAPVRLLVSGKASAQKLWQAEYWIEASAEGLGARDFLRAHRAPELASVLGLPSEPSDWLILTHEAAARDWKKEEPSLPVLATYRLTRSPGPAPDLSRVTHAFWASSLPFDELKDQASGISVHACGPGQTASRLRQAGVEPVVFPDSESWRQWIKTLTP